METYTISAEDYVYLYNTEDTIDWMDDGETTWETVECTFEIQEEV